MGFSSFKADTNACLRTSLKYNGVEYYQQELLCTDNILELEEPETFLREELGKRFTFKEKSIGAPVQHLGNKVSLVTLEDGIKCWSFGSFQCV